MKLINALYDVSIKKHNPAPKSKPASLDNCELALKMIDEAGVKTNFLRPNHLVDHDLKMILGMIWAIILDYQIKGISVEELSAKEGLLLWCQKKTAGYKDVKVDNFHVSFQDGLAFCALIHRHRPDLLDFDSLSKDNKAANLKLAFDVAEEKLGIPRLLDIEDLLDVPRPDEKAVMMYVAEYFHCFASQSQQETAGRRIAKVVGLTKQNDELKADYSRKAHELMEWINAATAQLQDHTFGNSVAGVREQLDHFDNFKKNQKPPKLQEKLHIETIFNNLSMKLRANNRPAFVPDEGLSLLDIDGSWQGLEAAETARGDALRDELARQLKLESNASRFFSKAQNLEKYANGKKNLLQSQEGETFKTVGSVQVRLQMLDAFDSDLKSSRPRVTDAEKLGNGIIAENYRDKDSIAQKIAEINQSWDSLAELSAQRRAHLHKALNDQEEHEALRQEFAKKAKAFERFLKDASEAARDHTTFGDTLEDVTAYRATLSDSEKDVLAQVASHRDSVVAVDSKLKSLGIEEADYRYTSITVTSLDNRAVNLKTLLGERVSAYETELKRQEVMEAKRLEFAKVASQFVEYLAAKRAAISAVDGEPEDQTQQVKTLHDKAEGQQKLGEIEKLDQGMREFGIAYNRHTNLSYPIIKVRWEAHEAFVNFTLEDIEQSLKLKEHTAAARKEAQQQQHLEDLRIEFAKKVQPLNLWIQGATEILSEPLSVKSVEAVEELQHSTNIIENEFDENSHQKEDIAKFNQTLADAGIHENPLSELSLEDIEVLYAGVGGLIASRKQQLLEELERQKENEKVRLEFAEVAQRFSNHVDESLAHLQSTSDEADINEQLAAVNRISFSAADLDVLKELEQKLTTAGVTDNKHTHFSLNDLAAKAHSLSQGIADKKALLEKELLAKQHNQVPAEQLKEIKECFTQFDKENKGHLIKYELKACLSALGESVTEEGLDALLSQYGDAEARVNLDKFTEFMIARLADTDSEHQILASFKCISGDRPFVTEDQLNIGFSQNPEALQYLLASIPAHPDGGYDYVAFVRSIFVR